MWSCVKYHFSWNDSQGWLLHLKSTGNFTQPCAAQMRSFESRRWSDARPKGIRSHGGRAAAGCLGCWLFGFTFPSVTIALLGLQRWDRWNSSLDDGFNCSSGGAQKRFQVAVLMVIGVIVTFNVLSSFLQFSCFAWNFQHVWEPISMIKGLFMLFVMHMLIKNRCNTHNN